MATYVMSDVHGEYHKFLKMLAKIDFKETDELIILGDIFDRGDKPLEILEYIVSHKNIKLILGNHEDFFLKAYESGFSYFETNAWFGNGGQVTYEALINKGQSYIDECYKYLKRRPKYLVERFKYPWAEIKVILCHAGIAVPDGNAVTDGIPSFDDIIKIQTDEDWLWSRDHINKNILSNDTIIICGHTPVHFIESGKKDILIRDSMIYIDCGACFEGGQLACVNINRGEVIPYYVN